MSKKEDESDQGDHTNHEAGISECERKRQDVRAYYKKLKFEAVNGIRRNRPEYCLCMTGKKFYLSPETVKKMVVGIWLMVNG